MSSNLKRRPESASQLKIIDPGLSLTKPALPLSVKEPRGLFKHRSSASLKETKSKIQLKLSNQNLIDSRKRLNSNMSMQNLNQSNPKASSQQAEAKKIQKKLEKDMKTNLFDACKRAFRAVIKQDEVFGAVLSTIRRGYESQIEKVTRPLQENNEKLKENIRMLNQRLQESLDIQTALKKKLEKIGRENAELSRTLESKDDALMHIQDQFNQVSPSAIPKSEQEWKYLITKFNDYAHACKYLKAQNKEFKFREKRLMRILVALKKRGVCLDEFMEDECYECPDDTDHENLVEGPPLSVNKPNIVPSLEMQDMDYESSSCASND